ncbi:MAG: DUF502 domain-containing protein [Saprospiraceae bacterium]|nr:DUF502 domain-containing protein [Saprospiraceae bacterium]
MNSDPKSGEFGTESSISSLLRKGLLITLPFLIYISLLYFLLSLLYRLLTPLSTMISVGSDSITWTTHLISIFLLLISFLFIGYLTQYQRFKRIAESVENRYLVKAPLYMLVRDTVQQFTGLKKMPFSQVVLVDPFDNGIKLTGFVSEEVSPDLYTIFVPTAPNPLNGNIYHVPVANLTFLSIPPEIAMRSIVSMGNGSSALFRQKSGSSETDEYPLSSEAGEALTA